MATLKLNGFSMFVRDTWQSLIIKGQFTRVPTLYCSLKEVWKTFPDATKKEYESRARAINTRQNLKGQSMDFVLAELVAADKCCTYDDGRLCNKCSEMKETAFETALKYGYW